MLAVDFGEQTIHSRKRSQFPLEQDAYDTTESTSPSFSYKRFRRVNEEPVPRTVNPFRNIQQENELKQLRMALEKKDKELREKTNLIQTLQNQLSASSSKVQQFDALAKSFMDQAAKLKRKEEEVSSLSTVLQRALAENRSLKSRLIVLDHESISNMYNPN